MALRTSLYGTVWYWDEETSLTYFTPSEGKDKAKTQVRNLVTQVQDGGEKQIHFLENIDQHQQKMFKQKLQRQVKANAPSVVTLQDIKDVVTFLMVGYVPSYILELIHSHKINSLFRALIVYFQLYLQVWDDLKYRRLAYAQSRLKHPISVVRESRCTTHLSHLRSLAGQEYTLLVTGEGIYKRYHHMDNPLNRSYTTKDILVYDYLVKFTARVVWVALYRSNYKEIEAETARLFHCKNVREDLASISVESILTQSDCLILHGDKFQVKSHWDTITPLVSDILLNEDKPELLLMKKVVEKDDSSMMTGLKALLTLPEEVLCRIGFTLGVLGQPRDSFETMLHIKQGPSVSLEEEELEKALINVETDIEKPMVKMNQYLKQLETIVDLNESTPTRKDEDSTISIKDEINCYISNHQEDSKRALKLWKDFKGHNNL